LTESGGMVGIAEWSSFLAGVMLLLIRVSGLMVFLPLFSSDVFPMRIKVGFTLALTIVLAPVAAAPSTTAVVLGPTQIAGELGVGLLLGLCLRMIEEVFTFAGHLLNLEFSFSLVNVLDPSSRVETPLMSQILHLFFLLVILASGLHRTMIAALMRTLTVVPLGHAWMDAHTAPAISKIFGGVLLGGLQLAAPVIAAAFLIEIAVSLAGRISPQLPVLILGIPLKTLTGYIVLFASVGLWPRYIESHFSNLLDSTFTLLQRHVQI
jgi:flagellar biosynthesis protein FliR